MGTKENLETAMHVPLYGMDDFEASITDGCLNELSPNDGGCKIIEPVIV